jgi:hypothetical protein
MTVTEYLNSNSNIIWDFICKLRFRISKNILESKYGGTQ